ncbi:hypothetical protein V8B55DRAFT_1320792 [Mucor lusitanicus]|uniref:Endonuclease/exonuclease/phosphatase domain-containing protein n=1 Tax=Mucor lusitanicus CBS 277.49 TaxID=747725 RepID=A0A168K8R9_MUCCL|nr:hypothetical protein MUCCIDRAFT_82499 [Mucor lusitanicus CBS 277.49]
MASLEVHKDCVVGCNLVLNNGQLWRKGRIGHHIRGQKDVINTRLRRTTLERNTRSGTRSRGTIDKVIIKDDLAMVDNPEQPDRLAALNANNAVLIGVFPQLSNHYTNTLTVAGHPLHRKLRLSAAINTNRFYQHMATKLGRLGDEHQKPHLILGDYNASNVRFQEPIPGRGLRRKLKCNNPECRNASGDPNIFNRDMAAVLNFQTMVHHFREFQQRHPAFHRPEEQ